MTGPEAECLVSVITPTFPGREQELFRCMERVLDLDWPNVQHVILSDRTNAEDRIVGQWQDLLFERPLAGTVGYDRDLIFAQINESWRNPITEKSIGAVPWEVGSLLGMGEFFAFCGDDDELLPAHVSLGVNAMRAAEALWSVSRVEFRAGGEFHSIIGDPRGYLEDRTPLFNLGSVDATGIMCHRDALQVASWSANGEDGADYRLVRDWTLNELRGVFVDEITGIHNDGWLVGKNGRPDRPR